jgi:hypothetical protein
MRSRSLHIEERELLLHCLKEHASDLINDFYLLDQGLVEAEKINGMREAVADELVSKGLLANDEPNEYGFRLEELIGRLANLYLWPEQKN